MFLYKSKHRCQKDYPSGVIIIARAGTWVECGPHNKEAAINAAMGKRDAMGIRKLERQRDDGDDHDHDHDQDDEAEEEESDNRSELGCAIKSTAMMDHINATSAVS